MLATIEGHDVKPTAFSGQFRTGKAGKLLFFIRVDFAY